MTLLSERRSCLPCGHGAHSQCRHHPNADGSSWIEDPKTGEKRLVLYEGETYGGKGKGAEIPRPPCACEVGSHVGEPGTCNNWKMTDSGGYFRCGKPAKGTIPVQSFGGKENVEVCGIHLYADRKKRANDVKWRAERDAKSKRQDTERSNSKASYAWAERLATEFHLPVKGIHNSADEILVGLSPETTYELLSRVRSLLDEVYDTHPFTD